MADKNLFLKRVRK